MPDATITSTASTFGTISGVFSADQSTISGTISGIVPGTLTGSVGVPGPAGPAGIGLPAGGASGQYLQKTSNADYATDWVTVNLTGLATESWVAAGFYPLTGNPSGFLTSASLSGYATETFVTSQGYITSSALTPYLTKADNLASVASPSTARSNLGLGSLDTPTFAGVNVPGSGTSVANLGATSLTINQQGSGQFTIQPSQGIVFPDATVQTTAFTGIPSAYISSVSSPLTVTTGNLSIDLSAYLTSATAASTYQTLSGMSSYLTTSAAASTYQALAGMSDYLAKAGNLAGLANTGTARTNLGLGSLAVVNDAPSDGSQYARKNGAWDVVSAGASYISSVSSPLSVTSGNLTIDLSAYAQLSGATFTGNVFAPTPSPGTDSTRIATTEWVKDFDYAPTNSPHFTGNPKSVTPSTGDDDTSIATTAFVKAQNYITSASLSGYATESWVTTELSDYLTTTTAATTYAALSGASDLGTYTWSVPMSSNSVQVDSTSISLNGSSSIYIGTTGTITYGDTTTQVTAYPGSTGFLLKADNLAGLANTGTARTNLGLGTMATATASDYSTTTAANGLYYPLSSNPSGFLTSAPVTSVAGRTGAVTLSNTDISGLGTLATVNDAPSDGNQYARKNGAWDIVSVPSSYITSVSSPLSVTSGNLSVDLSAYLTTASAASTYQTISGMSSYLTTSTAASTYQTISGMSSYLTTSAAASTYLTQSNAASTYQTLSGMSSYLTTSSAASTYQTQAGMSDYLSKAGNLAGLASTATARTNLGLGTMATATAADYSTTTAANALYYPLSSNPSGYLTTAPVTSVAGQTGAVTLAVADVSGAAPLASPALTGTPTAPTATGGTNTTQIATTAFVAAAIPTNNVKAWVNFNGRGTVAIRASMNVSSITDNGTGNYTVNFTTALADANYAAAGFAAESTFSVGITVGNFGTLTQTTSAFRFNTTYGTTSYDCTQVHMTILR